MINNNKINDNETNNNQDLNFIEKFKSSKKFRAKLELIGYGILILILIVYVNFSNSNSNNYNYIKESIYNKSEKNSDNNLLDNIKNNYKASINIISSIGEKKYEIESNESETLIKKIDDDTEYKKSDTGEFYTIDNILVEEKEIFDLIDYKYLELDNIKKYINKGVVDYTTKYSSGKEIISYKVMVRDILLDNTTEDYIIINVTDEDNKIYLDIDYTDLIKLNNVDNCTVKIIYTNISDDVVEGD